VDWWKLVNIDHTFSRSRQELHGKQARLWTQGVQDLRLDLDPYDCKAAYVSGMLRQFIEAAGLQLANEYHVGALVSAASAAELLGWCCKHDPGNQIEDGVAYLQNVGPPYLGPIPQHAENLRAWVREVRNFGAHGGSHGKRLTLDQVLTMWLLRSLAVALDAFWADDEDQCRHESFARAAITPLYSEGEPIFVCQVQRHLAQGLRLGEELDHQSSWRPSQPWEEQSAAGGRTFISTNTPAATGTPDVSGPRHSQ
jgi:hypothetical protein